MHVFTKAFWLQLSSPKAFYPLAGKLAPWLAGITAVLMVVGLYYSFFVAPVADFKQGASYRIIYIHVPAAWMSMFLYVVMCGYAAIGLIWNTRLSNMMASAIAPTGAMFTFLALWTGSLWGKPTWGTYWVWDARLTSELILLFLYFGYMALQSAIDDPQRAARASALLALVGVINVPIIYKSVEWWNTLHQPPSLETGKAAMEPSMLTALLIMVVAFWIYSMTVVLLRVRSIILDRERHSEWVSELVGNRK